MCSSKKGTDTAALAAADTWDSPAGAPEDSLQGQNLGLGAGDLDVG